MVVERIEQHCKQVLLHVAYLGGVLLQTVHDKLDVGAVQLQKTGADHLMGEVAARDPGGLPLGTDRFYQQLYDLVQVILVGGKRPASDSHTRYSPKSNPDNFLSL